MRRKLFFIVASLLTLSVAAQTADPLSIHPYIPQAEYNQKISHWSLYFPMGVTFADMDETGGAKLGSGINDLSINGGVGVEYNFTPLWGLSAEFQATNYGKGAFYARRNEEGVRVDKDGNPTSLGVLYNMGLYGTFDFADAFFPHRKSTLVSCYGILGGGIGVYTYQAADAQEFTSVKPGLKGYNWDPYIAMGLHLDFNATRSFGVGLRAMYNYYMSDNLDYSMTGGSAADNGRINSNNDGIFTVDAVLRWKIAGTPKSHMRNLTLDQYNTIMMARADMPRDTVVVMHKDTVVCKEIHTETASSSMAGKSFYVYFDNAKSTLREDAINTLQQVADALANNDDLYIDVIGYCDNTGSQDFNEKLAKRRAETVIDELMAEYGVGADHFLSSGRGKVIGARSTGAYSANRRAEIRLITREEFERLQQERNSKSQSVTQVSRDRESVNETTLTSLARRQYGNPNCWVYIYEANKDRIKDINNIGAISNPQYPVLTEEQRRITSEEAQAYYLKILK